MDIFCSHSGKDIGLIQPLKERMEAMGLTMYLFEDDIQPGGYVATKLQQAIERSTIVLVLLTHRSKQSAYVHQEIGYAAAQGKLIIPLVEEGVPKRVLGMLDGREYLLFKRGATSDEMLATVFESLQEYVSNYLSKMEKQPNANSLLSNEVMRDVLIGILVVAVLAIGIAYLTSSGPFSPPQVS